MVTAIRYGHWILLDEINLASSETLERLSGLLDGASGSIALTERGDIDQLERHPNFRIFAAMNPPTDVGKKDLPPSLRCRFTELFVDEVTEKSDLQVFDIRIFIICIFVVSNMMTNTFFPQMIDSDSYLKELSPLLARGWHVSDCC